MKKDGDGAPLKAAPTARDRIKNLHGFPPEPMYRFHGRAQELLELERAFRRGPAVVLTAMGGMGKTALAREAAAWWLRKKRFDAAVFHSFEQKAGADRVVQVLGQALEGADFSSRSAEEQWTSAVDFFRQRKVLFVWDNFESTLPEFQKGEDGDSPLQFGAEERRRLQKLYRQLTEDDPAGRLLVTCRPQETGLPGIKKIPLSGLARSDSLHLLSAVLYKESISTDRDGYERGTIDALLKLLDDHPLSISLVAPHLKTLRPAQIRAELRKGLARFADGSAEEARNSSLLASLAFSTRRLSEEAQGVLPYLSWFEGGTMEQSLLNFTQLDAEIWERIRGELVATALIRLEEVGFNTPFLRFHPTLPFAARRGNIGDDKAAETRFIAVYLFVMEEVDQALDRRQPAAGMALLALEEANFRSVLRRALRRGDRQEGAWIAAILGKYLERAGRTRERNDLLDWVRSKLPEAAELDRGTCIAIQQHAMALLNNGRSDKAVAAVQGLIARLEAEGLASGEDPVFEIATSYGYLAQIYINTRQPDLALEQSQRAIGLLEELPGDSAKQNFSAALGDLANAHLQLGQFNQALAAAERGLAIDRELGMDRNIAYALFQIANILRDQQHYAEAAARYAEALDVALASGDLGLQGQIVEDLAHMQLQMGNHGQAVELGRKALSFCEKAGDGAGEMGMCIHLGNTEQQLGHFDAAEAWYTRGRELAKKTSLRFRLGEVAQNLGSLYQKRAKQAGDPEDRDAHLRRAVPYIEESLAVWLETNNQVYAAASYQGLGILYQQLGELDRAEEYLHKSLCIDESLNLPNVYKTYGNLATVARDRGDAETADEWQAKRDAKVADLERLHRGDGTQTGVPAQLKDAILALARVVHDVRARGVSVPTDTAESLAQLSGLPAPLGAVGGFLREVAGGSSPTVPPGLPPEVGEILEELLKAVG